jgi:hypothetical protein
MPNNVLDRMLVVVLLGDDSVTESFSQNEVKALHGTGLIIMREAVASRAHLQASAQTPTAAFLDESRRRFEEGERLLFLCGYPKTAQEAIDLRAACKHVIAFSIEPPNSKHQQDTVRSILARSSKFYAVDSTRKLGQQHGFMRSRIQAIRFELKIFAGATAALPQTAIPAFA